jgi:alpha-glucosidase
MRTHEGLRASANWSWDGGPNATQAERDATIAHFRRFARIHDALGPTFATLADEAATTSIPILRHLLLEFPNDRNVVGIADEFLVGTDLLVAPITTEGATEREVYFPAGRWIHALRPDEVVVGPKRVTVSAPIGEPPVFWRETERVDLRSIQ